MQSSSEAAPAAHGRSVPPQGLRVLVAAWVGSDNLGDELLFACLQRRLASLGAEVCVISKSPGATRKLHGVRAVAHGDLTALYRELGRSHAMVFGGGGLLQDGTSLLNLPYHLSRVGFARVRRVPFIGMGLGVGPLRFRSSSWLVGASLRGHQGLTVRDEASAELLRQCGLSNIHVTSDLALALEPSSEPAQDQIALALRDYREGVVPARFRRAPRSDEMECKLAAALDEIQRRTRFHLRFMAFEGQRDEDFNRSVAARMKLRDFSFATPAVHDVIEQMRRCRLTIAMRYHGGVTSIVAERPVILIGYAPKVSALASVLGDDCRYVAHDPRAFEGLPDQVVELLGKNADSLHASRIRLRDTEHRNQAILEDFLLEAARAR